MITYDLQIDLDKNGLFQNTQGHIGSRLLSANWMLGMSNSYAQMVQPLQITIQVVDDSLDFSQDKPGSLFGAVVRDVMARIQATVNGETRTLVTGWITTIMSEDREFGSVSIISIECKTLQLQDAEYLPTVSTNTRIDTEIQAVFDGGILAYPYNSSFWIMSGSQLGVNTKLFTESFTDFEESQTTLEWAGDAADRGEGVSALGYIMDLVTAEVGGRFFVNRVGKFVFHSRHHDINASIVDTFTASEFDRFRLVTGEVYNEITLSYFPRDVGAVNTVLWSSDNVPVTINAKSKIKIKGRYRDASNEDVSVGGYQITDPVTPTDYLANSQEDGLGTNVTAELTWYFNPGGTSIEIAVDNTSGSDAYVTLLQVRGTPIKSFKPQQITEIDGESVRNYGKIPFLPLSAKFVSEEPTAQGFARQVLARYARPQTRYEFIEIEINDVLGSRDALANRVLARTIGDVVTVENEVTGHSRSYVIVGEAHTINGGSHRVRWTLRPSDRTKVWRIGISALDIDTLIAL